MSRKYNLSLHKMLSTSTHCNEERADLDLYVTPPMMVDELLNGAKPYYKIAKSVWEPAVGIKHISNRIKQLHPEVSVYETDLINRGDESITELDFLEYNGCKFKGDIITNPPYKYANEFYQKACESVTDGNWVWMFVKIQFLETSKRYEIFKKYRPNVVLCCSRRVECGKDGKLKDDWGQGGIAMYCWVGHQVGTGCGHPTYLEWINTIKH